MPAAAAPVLALLTGLQPAAAVAAAAKTKSQAGLQGGLTLQPSVFALLALAGAGQDASAVPSTVLSAPKAAQTTASEQNNSQPVMDPAAGLVALLPAAFSAEPTTTGTTQTGTTQEQRAASQTGAIPTAFAPAQAIASNIADATNPTPQLNAAPGTPADGAPAMVAEQSNAAAPATPSLTPALLNEIAETVANEVAKTPASLLQTPDASNIATETPSPVVKTPPPATPKIEASKVEVKMAHAADKSGASEASKPASDTHSPVSTATAPQDSGAQSDIGATAATQRNVPTPQAASTVVLMDASASAANTSAAMSATPNMPVVVVRAADGMKEGQLPLDRIAVGVVRQMRAGENRFEIRLDPPELGRIEVKMNVSHDGRVSAHLTADRADTLDLLQRDARMLQRALADAGLDTDGGSLSFQLREHAQRGGDRQDLSFETDDEDTVTDEVAAVSQLSLGVTAGRVDLRI